MVEVLDVFVFFAQLHYLKDRKIEAQLEFYLHLGYDYDLLCHIFLVLNFIALHYNLDS